MSKMLDSLRESRAAKAAEAADLLAGEPTVESIAAVEERHAEIENLDAQIEKVEATEARAAAIVEARAEVGIPTVGYAKVGAEPMTYSEHGQRSFVRDLINAQVRNDQSAWSSLHRHMDEVRVETRDISRTDGGIGEFVPPLWLVDQYARTLRPGRTTADLLTKMALPAGTDSINIPRITTGSDVAVQTADNAATTNQDMVTTSVTAPVRTISGYENVSLQLVEQSPLAGGIDRMIFADLMAAYDYRLDVAVLNGSGTAGDLTGLFNTAGIGTVTYTAGTPTAAGYQTAFAQVLSTVAKNRFQGAEAIVLAPEIWYGLVGLSDSQGRPVVVPSANGPMNSVGINGAPGAAQGSVGTILGVPCYLDAAIPTISSAKPALVAAFSDTMLFESGMKTRVLPDVLSANLTVRFQLYGYAAIAARYPAGVAKVIGTGFNPQSGY
jgi:HK97 family phage major capsid protein